jgi:hypothetical protein
MHIFPDSTTGDRTSHLGEASSQKLANIVSGKNVLAFLHGHFHDGSHTTWNGIDVLGTGFCYMASGCPGRVPTFQVIKITDNHMVAVEFNWDTNTWGQIFVNKSFDSAFPVAGDANSDNKVDVGDLGILAANYGMTSGATWAKGDFNGDGAVDVGDLGILAANYGKGASGADFDADYAKVFGSVATDDTTVEDTETTSSVCSGLGLPLVAGLTFMGLMLVKLRE